MRTILLILLLVPQRIHQTQENSVTLVLRKGQVSIGPSMCVFQNMRAISKRELRPLLHRCRCAQIIGTYTSQKMQQQLREQFPPCL